MILGVCEWLSARTEIDVRLLRAIFLIAVIIFGTGIAAYLILYLVKIITN